MDTQPGSHEVARAQAANEVSRNQGAVNTSTWDVGIAQSYYAERQRQLDEQNKKR
jgi:hypothetical protein